MLESSSDQPDVGNGNNHVQIRRLRRFRILIDIHLAKTNDMIR